jgi:hypothetical protein
MITPAASAGGSWLEPTRVRVEAGETITLSGEVAAGQQGWVDEGPYFAYLSGATYGSTINARSDGLETDVLLGQLVIDAGGESARISIEFTLPGDVPPGEYWVTACNMPCREGFGDLIGATLFVGVDAPTGDGGTEDEEAVVAASPILAGAEDTDGARTADRAATSLALARHPARPTGLDATWIAISAGFGLAVLLLVSAVRTRGG